MGPRAAGLDGRKISSPPGFGPVLSSPQSVTVPTELPGPQMNNILNVIFVDFVERNSLVGFKILIGTGG